MEDEPRPMMGGTVEVDETYIGGKTRRRRRGTWGIRGRGTDKPILIGIRQRGGDLRFFHAEDVASGWPLKSDWIMLLPAPSVFWIRMPPSKKLRPFTGGLMMGENTSPDLADNPAWAPANLAKVVASGRPKSLQVYCSP